MREDAEDDVLKLKEETRLLLQGATPFKKLGLKENADKKEVNKAYRRLALKFHQDKWPLLFEKISLNETQCRTAWENLNNAKESILNGESTVDFDTSIQENVQRIEVLQKRFEKAEEEAKLIHKQVGLAMQEAKKILVSVENLSGGQKIGLSENKLGSMDIDSKLVIDESKLSSITFDSKNEWIKVQDTEKSVAVESSIIDHDKKTAPRKISRR